MLILLTWHGMAWHGMNLCLFGGEKVQNFSIVRTELKRMKKRDLLDLAFQQKKRWCDIGASECAFLIEYKGFAFCLTELMGQGCPSKLENENSTEDQNQSVKDKAEISTLWGSSPNDLTL
jgi:hypothetical protein